MKRKNEFDFWISASLMIFLLYTVFMVYPLLRVVSKSVVSAETGRFSLKYFIQFFSEPYYYTTLSNSFKVAVSVAAVSLVIGIPLAYLYNMYETRGRKTLQLLIILKEIQIT